MGCRGVSLGCRLGPGCRRVPKRHPSIPRGQSPPAHSQFAAGLAKRRPPRAFMCIPESAPAPESTPPCSPRGPPRGVYIPGRGVCWGSLGAACWIRGRAACGPPCPPHRAVDELDYWSRVWPLTRPHRGVWQVRAGACRSKTPHADSAIPENQPAPSDKPKPRPCPKLQGSDPYDHHWL